MNRNLALIPDVVKGLLLMWKLNEISLYEDLKIVYMTNKLMIDKHKYEIQQNTQGRETYIGTQPDCIILQPHTTSVTKLVYILTSSGQLPFSLFT